MDKTEYPFEEYLEFYNNLSEVMKGEKGIKGA